MTVWFATRDGSQARIFEARGRGRPDLVRELSHPQA